MTFPSYCPNCRQPLQAGVRYCPACGYPLAQNPRRASILIFGVLVLGLAVVAAAAFFLLRNLAQPPVPTLTAEEQFAKSGGWELIFEVDEASGQTTADQLEGAARVMRLRLDSAGVATSTVRVTDNARIQVHLMGVSNPDQISTLLSDTGLVEFVDTGNTAIQPGAPLYTDWSGLPYLTPGPNDVVYHTLMTGDQVASASVSVDQLGNYQVSLLFDETGTQILSEFTRNNVGKYLSISYNRVCLSSPRIATEIADGKAVLSGSLTMEEANRIAAALNSGSLPYPLKLVESQVLGPTAP